MATSSCVTVTARWSIWCRTQSCCCDDEDYDAAERLYWRPRVPDAADPHAARTRRADDPDAGATRERKGISPESVESP